jgi:hypothetical protein
MKPVKVIVYVCLVDVLAKLTKLFHQGLKTLQQVLERASEGRRGLKTGLQRT